ncbi:LPXTG cell wall anchor domain-containing protein [Angelakisella massiliensis]|uniref:LPXTG cell wall anchor domain-containing protein n=1 Tax=Angelakisella massiliensis TaxID=1871018 RepID=UPI0008F8D748|nr:LPXTG cell wall anchor domain-containing protein [Angelakisella massiliensis]
MNPSIGVIGGADGPTAVFVAFCPSLPLLAVGGLAGVALIAGLFWYTSRKKQHKRRNSHETD